MRAISRSPSRLLFFLALLCAGYFAYTAVAGAVRAQRLDDQLAEYRQEIARLEQQRAYLEGVLEYVRSDEYVEQVARRELGYVREGEVPVVVVGPTPTEPPPDEWWEWLFPR